MWIIFPSIYWHKRNFAWRRYRSVRPIHHNAPPKVWLTVTGRRTVVAYSDSWTPLVVVDSHPFNFCRSSEAPITQVRNYDVARYHF